ncbi:periplakin isoform X1 [Amblyraja radiata]|uniref:periplakin isoform X1 n=1 Tax=Amblyraja radiata TaxID=386614 RepID=UPI00140300F9|nr:periplakin isoform X1 [Amblyraja radiata]
MFKKKSKPTSPTKKTPSTLSQLIVRLQQNADVVEKNIYKVEECFLQDVKRIEEGKHVLFHDDTEKLIDESEVILANLQTDAQVANSERHPQSDMITEDVKQLKERIKKLKMEHKKVYSLSRVDGVPTFDWSKMIDEKQAELNNGGFGNELPFVDQQLEHHQLFSKEVETIGDHINKNENPDYISGIQVKYNKLSNGTQQRQKDLLSLREYMQNCTNELYWMDTQEEDRLRYDWSDQNLDYKNRHRQYENFVNRHLEAKEAAVTKLHDEGNKLLQTKHPGKNAVEAHMGAVHADWKEYLNLLICEENHLKNMDDYHKYYKDSKDMQELLKKIDNDMDLKYNSEFKDEFQLQTLLRDLDDQDRALDKYDNAVKTLKKRSCQVMPLKNRRANPSKAVPVEALCDFDAEETHIQRGESYTLLKNINGTHWEVSDSAGQKQKAPAVCFIIPPTDLEAVAIGNDITNQYNAVKLKSSTAKNTVQKSLNGLKHVNVPAVKTAVVPGSNTQDQQCLKLLSDLDKIQSDTTKQEKAIQCCTRPPLEQPKPIQDIKDRIQDLKNINGSLSQIELTKMAKERDCQSFLAQNPQVAGAPQLRSKLDDTNDKFDQASLLLNSSEEKAQAVYKLENSLQKGRNTLSEFENKLIKDQVIPDSNWGLDSKTQELEAMRIDLKSKKPILQDAEQNLNSVKRAGNVLADNFQEHCLDVERQDTDVKKLNQRYDNINKQLDSRIENLQKAKSSYSSFRNGSDTLDSWLSNIPNYEPQEHDSTRTIDNKLKKQMNLLTEITNKEPDLAKTITNANQYQQVAQDYEREAELFKSLVQPDSVRAASKKPKITSPADKVKDEEIALATKFATVKNSATQQMGHLEFAQSLLKQQPEEQMIQQNVQSQNYAAAPGTNYQTDTKVNNDLKHREEVVKKISKVQDEIATLRSQQFKGSLVKKEVVKKVADPQLDEELQRVQTSLAAEQLQNKTLDNEMEILQRKLLSLEKLQKDPAQQYVVKEVLRIEHDKDQENEILRLKEELEELERQKSAKENDIILLQKRLLILTEEKNKEQEKITEQVVFKVKKDPEMEAEFNRLQDTKQHESLLRQQKEEELKVLQEKLKQLEREKAKEEEKVTVKEVVRMEKDANLEKEVTNFRRQHEEEMAKKRLHDQEINDLGKRIKMLEEEKSKPVVQEKLREIVRPDPNAEAQVVKLRSDVLEQERLRNDVNLELRSISDEISILKDRGPKIEIKDNIKEVIKYKPDPETEQALERLRDEVLDKSRHVERSKVEINQLDKEIEMLRNSKPDVQIKEVINEVTQYKENQQTRQELVNLKAKLAEEQKKQLEQESERLKHEANIQLKKKDLAKVREKVVQQEVVKVQQDPLLLAECGSMANEIEQERKQKVNLRAQIQTLQRRKADLEEQLLELEAEREARRKAELEVKRLKIELTNIEEKEKEVRDKVTLRQKVVLQKDPMQETEVSLVKLNLEEVKANRTDLENELQAMKLKQIELESTKTKVKNVFTEKVQVERDPETELEVQNLRKNLEAEGKLKQNLQNELDHLKTKLSDTVFNDKKSTKDLEHLRDENSNLQREIQSLLSDRQTLHSDIEVTVQQTKEVQSEKSTSVVDKMDLMETRFKSLQKELDDLRKSTGSKEVEIEKLEKELAALKIKREQRENSLRRHIVVIDPDNGKEMSPREAYNIGLIDYDMYINLENQECDWEEITVKDPSGTSTVLHDRKSGEKYSVSDALKKGKITEKQYKKFIDKEITIQEFAVLVAGKHKMPHNDIAKADKHQQVSSGFSPSKDKLQAIGGIIDADTEMKISIPNAANRNLIDSDTALRLLEAQAATGGIVFIKDGSRYNVIKAAELGLIDRGLETRLSSAESAYTGIENPQTKELLPAIKAVERGWLYSEAADWYLEAQYLTGGLVDPATSERRSLRQAISSGLIDEARANRLKDDTTYPKNLVEPISKHHINYKEALDLCIPDQETGLLLLPVSSKSN